MDGDQAPASGRPRVERALRARLAVAVLVVLAILAAAGCSVVYEEPAPDSPAGQGRGQPANCGTTLENCYSFEQMDQFVQKATVQYVAPFFEASYPSMPVPEVAFVPSGTRGRSPCTDPRGGQAVATDQSYEYCPANHTIYVGQDAVWAMYDQLGDAAPVVALAHEWGHHVQTMTRVPPPRSPAESVGFENQADCVAGAWTKHADEQKLLEYPDDLRDIGALLEVIGSREGPDRDHGSTEERTQAFTLGFRQGLPGCNRFSPGTPIS